MKALSLSIVSVACVLGAAGAAQADFNYPDFSSVAGLNFVGVATQNVATNSVYLTSNPATSNQAGGIWAITQQTVALGFTAEMSVRVPFKNGVGADGIAFVLQNQSATAIGAYAGGLGYANNPRDPGTTGISNGLAVELDMWSNVAFSDVAGSHVSIQSNGTGMMNPLTGTSLGSAAMPADLHNGNILNFTVQYTPGTMSVFFNGSLTPTVTASVDLSTLLSLNTLGNTVPGRAWVGITASNGDAPNSATYEVLSFRFTTIPTPGSAALLGLGGLLAARRRR